MILKAVLTGMFDSNCYILSDANEAAVIDPGADAEDIARVLGEQSLKLKYIILTHAHIDHITEVDNLKSALGGNTVVHEDDAPLLGDRMLNGSALFGRSRIFNMADILVRDGDSLELGRVKLGIIHTPGHTPGSMCILVPGEGGANGVGNAGANGADDAAANGVGIKDCCIFTGDTLFRQGIGRTDLGAGDQRKIMASLRRLMELEGSLKVYPGHGPATSIDYEKRNNPWL